MAKKISEFTLGYNAATQDIIFNLLWRFFGARDIDAALRRRERKIAKTKAAAAEQKAKSRAAAAGSGR